MTSASRPPSRAIRWFVWGFLAVFFVCAAARLEAWPFTGFRLFSTIRTGNETTWVADTVDEHGTQTQLWFSALPRPYQGFFLLMRGFPRLRHTQQQAMCHAWLHEARTVRPGTTALRIYRVRRTAVPRLGDRPRSEEKVLEYACS